MNIPILHYLDQQRFVLSVILSYLGEYDGTSFLITNKVWSRRILPLFQLPPELVAQRRDSSKTDVNSSTCTNGNGHERKVKQARHKFLTLPIQDSNVLLARLNSKRLRMRLRTKVKFGLRRDDKCTICQENGNDDNGILNHHCCKGIIHQIVDGSSTNNQNSVQCTSAYAERECYPLNMTTDEIAWYEWNQSRLQFSKTKSFSGDDISPKKSSSSKPTSELTLHHIQCQLPSIWDTKLELLRCRTPPLTTYHNIPKQITISSLPPTILPNITLLTSYPRSGNTLLRNLLERITNFVTGSDTRPDRTLSKSLALDHNLTGEGIIDGTVSPIVKTHFPERRGYASYNASRVILLVRNPYDAIDSYWNMCCTNTHTESVVDDIYDLYQDKFFDLARSEIHTWFKFVKFWLTKANTKFNEKNNAKKSNNDNDFGQGPSILVIRFEDLISRTECIMEDVISFIIHGDSYSDLELHPFWKWRINHGLDLKRNYSSPPSNKVHSERKSIDKSLRNLNNNVNTLQLGSYTPRSENKNKLATIGKSIRKGRYPEDILRHYINISKLEEYQLKYEDQKVNILEFFNYNPSSQNFPFNHDLNEISWSFNDYLYRSKTKVESNVRVNVGQEVRPKASQFGRAMTEWRRSQTNNDKNPFPTVQKGLS